MAWWVRICAGWQHYIHPCRIYRRHFVYEPLLVAHYTRRWYYTSISALLRRVAFVEAMLQPRRWPDEFEFGLADWQHYIQPYISYLSSPICVWAASSGPLYSTVILYKHISTAQTGCLSPNYTVQSNSLAYVEAILYRLYLKYSLSARCVWNTLFVYNTRWWL